MHTADFHFDLPPAQIAQPPLPERTASRLLTLINDVPEHRAFVDLMELLQPGDLLVLNDTRVVKARLHAIKDSGGRAEVLLERALNAHECLAQVRVSKPLKPGRSLRCNGGVLEVVAREGVFYRLRSDGEILALFERSGEIPLPPYIERSAAVEDERSYQTVYANEPGAVAAPTAGLHFSEALLEQVLSGRGGTLHGAEVTVEKAHLRVFREAARVEHAISDVGDIWDQQWVLKDVQGAFPNRARVRALGDDGWQQIPDRSGITVPFRAARALPSVWAGDGLLACPGVGFGPEISATRYVLGRADTGFEAFCLSH